MIYNNKEVLKNKFSTKLALILAIAIIIQSLTMLGIANAAVTSSLTATIYNSTTISLQWYDYFNDEKYYVVERKLDAGSFINISASSANFTGYTDTVEAGHIYTYRIKVKDAAENIYIYTDEVTFQTDIVDKPNSLTITPISTEQIDIKWTYPNQKAYNTLVERRVEGSSSWTQIANIGMGQNTYSDKSIGTGIRYYYKVRAYSSDNVRSTAYPDEFTGSSTYTLLYKPTEFYGFALTQYAIQLNWKDNSQEKAFIIERRSPGDGLFKEIAVVPENSNMYIDNDTNLETNVLYAYRIKAVTGATTSEYSDIISVAMTYLKTPGTLSSTCADGKSVNLVWFDLTDNETGYEIWRKAGSSTVWQLYETMGRNATTFIDQAISNQDTYSYKVRARINDNSVYSNFSNETTIWTSIISAPTNLDYKTIGKNEIELNWQDTSTVEGGYKVERKIGYSGQWYVIAHLDADSIKYNDKWVNNTDIYFYRVKVFDRSNAINYSNQIAVSMKAPEAPTDLKAEVISSGDVLLTWKDNSYTENEFIIESMQFYSFREIGRVGRDTTTFIHKNISPNVTLSFRVVAVSGASQSSTSNEVMATTKSKKSFSDLDKVQWAVTAINNLASRNVFDAKANSKFYPSQNISRGEYCAIVVRSLELSKVSAGRFADVTSKDKYYKEIMTASKLGIISADKSNKLYPNKAITREQAGVMLALALKIKGTPLPAEDGNALKQFADYRSISTTSAEKIAAICGAGILSGRTIKGRPYLQLTGYVTRAEAAVMAYKAINLKE